MDSETITKITNSSKPVNNDCVNQARNFYPHNQHNNNNINNNSNTKLNSNYFKNNYSYLKHQNKINKKLNNLKSKRRRVYNYSINNSKHKLGKSLSNNQHVKMPILASIELATTSSNNELEQQRDALNNQTRKPVQRPNNESNVLFKDYVLIPSRTKFKHLIYTVLDQVNLPNKDSYNVLDGKRTSKYLTLYKAKL